MSFIKHSVHHLAYCVLAHILIEVFVSVVNQP